MVMGFVQSFTYAEIAGLFPNKSGGASIYGATAWLRYSKLIAPLSVWCNWFAWSPVLSLGCAIAAGYILNALAPIPAFTESPEVVAWLADRPMPARRQRRASPRSPRSHAGDPQLRRCSASPPRPRTLNFNCDLLHRRVLMLIVFAIQHRGILGTANVQKCDRPASSSCRC